MPRTKLQLRDNYCFENIMLVKASISDFLGIYLTVKYVKLDTHY